MFKKAKISVLQELNKCKTELQYWRSKSTTLLALPSTCASCSAPLLPTQSAEDAEAELKALANQGIFLTEDLTENNLNDVQNKTGEEPASSSNIMSPASPMTRGQSCKSGPPSPVSAVGRKRRSRDIDQVTSSEIEPEDSKRKSSLRGGSNRFKRPKTASAN